MIVQPLSRWTTRVGLSISGVVGLASLTHAQVKVGLQSSTATFSQSVYGPPSLTPDLAIDGDTTSDVNGWAILENNLTTTSQTAAWEFTSDLDPSQLLVKLYCNHKSTPKTLLGRFRISVCRSDRAYFADGLFWDGDVTTNWIALTPTSITLPSGMTSTILSDGSVLVGGTIPKQATYEINFDACVEKMTGIRLEAIEDPSLPGNGPGTASNGNFLVNEIEVFRTPIITASSSDVAPDPFDFVTITAWGGHPRGAGYLVLESIDGVPMFSMLDQGIFSDIELYAVGDTIPPELTGLTLQFRVWGACDATGKLVPSDPVVVTIS